MTGRPWAAPVLLELHTARHDPAELLGRCVPPRGLFVDLGLGHFARVDDVVDYEPGSAWCWVGRAFVRVPLEMLVARGA